jgi:hypothetical protein
MMNCGIKCLRFSFLLNKFDEKMQQIRAIVIAELMQHVTGGSI